MVICFKKVIDSILKSRDVTLPTKLHLIKVMVFPVVMHGCESWTIQKAECWRINAFELWCWWRSFRVPWTARRSNQSILKEISPEYSLEGPMLKLNLPILCPPDVKNWLIGKDPDAGKDWRWEQKGTTEDEMVGWHHRLGGHAFEQPSGVVVDREVWRATVHESQRVGHNWATELRKSNFPTIHSACSPASFSCASPACCSCLLPFISLYCLKAFAHAVPVHGLLLFILQIFL